MKKLFQSCLAMCFLLLLGSSSYGQRTITGSILDAETNEPLIGANVLIKGYDTGTIADIDGNFSVNMPDGANTLVISYAGYTDQEIDVTGTSNVNIALQSGQLLDEIVVVGYGSQSEKEITSAVVKLDSKDFNQGAINDPAQLLQGKVAGLQVYNRGGDPNGESVIRVRGLSTVGANVQPLIVIDGIVGASLDNVDPNDIESVNVLKDGSAAAIYGSRGSSGVIIVTTKKGQMDGGVKLSYNGQVASSSPVNSVSIMTGDEFVAAGGTDLGSRTDWVDQVTRSGLTHTHGLSASGGSGNTSFRISANIRDAQGILLNSGFDQFNTRLNLSTRALNDKLKIDFSSSYTKRDQQNGFNEALRYAVLYNPTAPVYGVDSSFPFNSDQFGTYFETLGLFDSFNPLSIIQQSRNDGQRNTFNYGANFGYSLTDNLSLNFRTASQTNDYSNRIYYPTTANFRGNASSPLRKGIAEFYEQNTAFTLYEGFATYLADLGDATSLTFTAGYSYQEDDFVDNFFSVGDFPNNDLDFSNLIESSQDLQNAGFLGANSNASPSNKIIAFFGRANLTFNNSIFVNASLRREGSSKLGTNNKWGLFPSLGLGVDLNEYLNLGGVDRLKLRIGYGVTGALPNESGLSQPIRSIVNDGATGAVATELIRAANDSLKWEQKKELNFGLDYESGRLSGSLDVYSRTISDFILLRSVDAALFGIDKRVENAGELKTNGIELALNYDVVKKSNFNYNTGIVFSKYKTTLEEYVVKQETRGNLGSPGQNGTNMVLVREGEEIGQIWGPVFDGVSDSGEPIFQDLNGDGMLITAQDKALDSLADFQVLGKGTPDFEIGWTNSLTFGDWSVNAFIRGAFGHSLVNTFRAFYEPQVSTQSSYNYVNTSLAEEGLTAARFSSLYVEKADFIKIDNISISRNINIPGNSFDNARLTLTMTNPLVLTSYTGTDPEPSLIDTGSFSNGEGDPNYKDVLAPGIDRRNSYFNARTITLGLNLNF